MKHRYKVKEHQSGVRFLGDAPTFNTKKEAVQYARDFRNSFIKAGSPLKKVNETTFSDQPIFKAVHPAWGVDSYAKVIKYVIT